MPSSVLLEEFCPLGPVTGCHEIRVRRSQAVFALWEAWEQEAGRLCPVPFWAVVWPAAQVLARFILDQPDIVRGKEVIEVGCGGAVASIAACKAGARTVTANDVDPVALEIACQNAAHNRVYMQFDSENHIETGRLGRLNWYFALIFFIQRKTPLLLRVCLKNAGTAP